MRCWVIPWVQSFEGQLAVAREASWKQESKARGRKDWPLEELLASCPFSGCRTQPALEGDTLPHPAPSLIVGNVATVCDPLQKPWLLSLADKPGEGFDLSACLLDFASDCFQAEVPRSNQHSLKDTITVTTRHHPHQASLHRSFIVPFKTGLPE